MSDIKSLIGTLVGGIILLYLEYKSGLFQTQPGQTMTLKRVLGVVGTLVALLAIYAGLSTYVFTEHLLISIDDPVEGTTVPALVTFQGHHSGVPSDKEMLLTVHNMVSSNYRVYAVNLLTNGRWQVLNVSFDEPTTNVATFKVAVILVDHITSAQLQQGPSAVTVLPVQPIRQITLYRKVPDTATAATQITAATSESPIAVEPTVAVTPVSNEATEPTAITPSAPENTPGASTDDTRGAERERQLADINVLLAGGDPLAPASPERIATVRGYLRDDDAYQQLTKVLLQLLQGKRFKRHVHLDTINGTYIQMKQPGANYLSANEYNDMDTLKRAILDHWNALPTYPKAKTFEEIIEPKPPIECPQIISFGQIVQCSIDKNNEVDTYTFMATQGDNIQIAMLPGNGTLEPKFILQQPNGMQVDGCTVGGAGRADGSCTAPSTGTYTLLVSDNLGNKTGTYTLIVSGT